MKKLSSLLVAAGTLSFLGCGTSVNPPRDVTVRATNERLERGKYLAHSASGCIECHSKRNWNLFAGPLVPGSEGGGGEFFDKKHGVPGKVYPSNITPAALKDWTDGEIVSAITQGVGKDKKVLFPLMPFPVLSKLDREDVYSIVSYIRSIPPVENKVPKSKIDFPVNVLVRLMPDMSPKLYQSPQRPSMTDGVAYGKYMTYAAGCVDCHLTRKGIKVIKGMDFAGGTEFGVTGSDVRVYSANITPDSATGIGKWSEEEFIRKFKRYAEEDGQELEVKQGKNTAMAWTFYAGMAQEDLGAIYQYLRTQKAITNKVKRYSNDE